MEHPGDGLGLGGFHERQDPRREAGVREQGAVGLNEGGGILGAEHPAAADAELEAIVAPGIVAGGDKGESGRAVGGRGLRAGVGHQLGGGDDEKVAHGEAEAEEDPGHRIGDGRSRGPRVHADQQCGRP
jgi:hypothetical protein